MRTTSILDRITVWTWQHKRSAFLWSLVVLCSLTLAVYLAASLAFDSSKTLFLSDATSNGHYQFEEQCDLCHKPFEGDMQARCVECHGEELKQAEDSHRAKKFKDPREAQYLEKIAALECVTCHREHQTERTLKMSVTQPKDFCIACHEDIAEDRPSHKSLPFDGPDGGCSQCHNYHDNRALYEDFLAKHQNEADTLPAGELPKRDLLPVYRQIAKHPIQPLTATQQDGPANSSAETIKVWADSSHAHSGVNCTHCHARPDWQDNPGDKGCSQCHQYESDSFKLGRHGMRRAQKLPAMSASQARLPMEEDASHQGLSCSSCHAAHDFDTKKASIEACLGCHADQHSKNYKASKHYKLLAGEIPPVPGQSGVSCSGCHFPREVSHSDGLEVHRVNHNQNDNLRPNSKQIRGVCMRCHGLGFSLDALASKTTIRNNFSSPPDRHLDSLEMVAKREKRSKKSTSKSRKLSKPAKQALPTPTE